MNKQSSTLKLYEELLLLALKDDEGTPEGIGTNTSLILGSGILAELLLRERVTVEQGRWSKKLKVIDASPIGDPILDQCLKMLAGAKREADSTHWIGKFGNIKEMHHSVAQQLADKGILRAETIKVLRLFSKRIYPELNPAPEQKLIERLRRAIFEVGVGIDQQTIALLAIANATDLLRHAFDKRELKAQQEHIKQLIEGEQAGEAAKAAADAAVAAALIVIMVVT